MSLYFWAQDWVQNTPGKGKIDILSWPSWVLIGPLRTQTRVRNGREIPELKKPNATARKTRARFDQKIQAWNGSTRPQEPPNSLLSHPPSHSESFSAWAPKSPPLLWRLALCRFWKKVLREPGSKRQNICQKLKLSETIGIDSGCPK